MKPIEDIVYFDEPFTDEWDSLQQITQSEFEEILGISNPTKELALIIGFKDQEDEIWDWREYFKEVKDLTNQANYEDKEYDEEDGLINIQVHFGFVALVEFVYKDKTYKGILFQDASPAGIYIKRI